MIYNVDLEIKAFETKRAMLRYWDYIKLNFVPGQNDVIRYRAVDESNYVLASIDKKIADVKIFSVYNADNSHSLLLIFTDC